MRGIAITGNTFPFTITGNRTWSGFQTFQGTTGQSNPTAEFRAATSQTGNLLEFYNAAGTRVAYFDQSGNFTSTGAVSYSSTSVVQGASGIGFSVKAYGAGNSSDLQQWQNSGGSVLLGITSAGALYGATGLAVSGTLSAAQGSFTTSGLANTVSLTDNGVDGANLELSSTQGTSTAPNKYLRSYAGQFQIRNSANGATILALDDAGNLLLNKLQIREDASTADPGVAWLRNTATTGDLVVNPSGSGQLYLALDVKNQTNVGGTFAVGTTTGLQLRADNSNADPGVPWIRSDGTNIFVNPKSGGHLNLAWDNTSPTFTYIGAGGLVVIGGINLNYGTNTETLVGNVNLYVNTASSGSTGGRFSFSSNGPTGNDGGYIEYAAAAAGNTANRINFTGNGGGQLSLFTINSANTVIGVNGISGAGISIRGDNSSADPGMPWIRSDGSSMYLSPHSAGHVYIGWDNPTTTYFGAGGINAGGSIISTTGGVQAQNGGIITTGGGNIISSGTLYGHGSYPAVEANGSSNMHLEVYTNGGSQSTATNNTWGMTINFARAFNNIPAIGASCATSAGIGFGAIGVGVRNPSTTSVSVYFQNLDSGTQTLSNASAVIAGTNN